MCLFLWVLPFDTGGLKTPETNSFPPVSALYVCTGNLPLIAGLLNPQLTKTTVEEAKENISYHRASSQVMFLSLGIYKSHN